RLSILIATTLTLIRVGMSGSPVTAEQEVTVADGDSLTAIALRYYGDAKYAREIAAFNRLTDADQLALGEVLELPDLPPQGGAVQVGTRAESSQTGAATPSAAVVAAASAPRAGPVIQTGLATWYGPGFEGQLTKCGQVFHESDMTASSNDLPCGAVIQVTNVRDGASVVVTVDDTGDFEHPTILDLSERAFSALASTDAGVLEVSVAPILARLSPLIQRL
ncbi:MAG TPA: RlpA-like double-psi beta-barrel domain-containing protein, partial [Dehalococcoidia bacterium]|nr:RlpA-like double-psi beta-barrel domain-containing protein [Dehalococcoidia bacterium]